MCRFNYLRRPSCSYMYSYLLEHLKDKIIAKQEDTQPIAITEEITALIRTNCARISMGREIGVHYQL